MQVNNHKLSVLRTAHYATLGEVSDKVKYLFIVCHGYGQLAKHFIRKFDVIAGEEVLVVAPEGLSRFYWQGFSGDVVASWMTKGDRLDEIKDYSAYLQQLYLQYIDLLSDQLKIVLLGFSQGCATQLRWIMRYFPHFDQLVIWAGLFPEDLDYRPYQTYFNEKRIDLFYGDEDPLVNPERLQWQQDFLIEQGLTGQFHSFSGKHTVDRPTLKNWFEEIRN